jgi:hypothetical protein
MNEKQIGEQQNMSLIHFDWQNQFSKKQHLYLLGTQHS